MSSLRRPGRAGHDDPPLRKPEVRGLRRMGVALALGQDVEEAKSKAVRTASLVKVKL